jgi:hypothetical protein
MLPSAMIVNAARIENDGARLASTWNVVASMSVPTKIRKRSKADCVCAAGGTGDISAGFTCRYDMDRADEAVRSMFESSLAAVDDQRGATGVRSAVAFTEGPIHSMASSAGGAHARTAVDPT